MRNLQDVLKEKEAELARLNQEVEALRLVARLLADNSGDQGRSSLGEASRDRTGMAPRVKVFP